MEKLGGEAKRLMEERFGRDSIIALATMEADIPHVRYVNGYYEGDVNTCILCIRLADGCLLSHGTRYEIDFCA
ncbi:MAG: hypothetical protein NC337_07595 [Roseburia sp.]|nr:hypothetical protein [Roseburia sp.]